MNMQWTFLVILMASAGSGLLTYNGMTYLTPMADWWLKSVLALITFVTTISMSLFWQYAFSIVPELSKGQFRIRGWSTVLAGVVIILHLSSFWNVAALTKTEIDRLGGSSVVAMAQSRFTIASRMINAFQTFVGDVSTFGADTRDLQKGEIAGGSSGVPKAGPVSNTFGQVAKRLESIVKSARSAKSELLSLQSKASGCLADLSTAMGAGENRQASQSVSCINQTLSQMAGIDVASTIERGLSSLTSGVIVPANVRTKAQREAIRRFLNNSMTRADKLAKAIANRKPMALPEPLTLERPNVLEGVLLHWKSLIPPIATALAIDLLPLVLLIFTVLRFDDQIARNKPRRVWSASDLLDALHQARELERTLEDRQSGRDLPDYIDLTPVASKTITSSPAPEPAPKAAANAVTTHDGSDDDDGERA